LDPRSHEAYRRHLHDTFCVENLDFFVDVAQYKYAATHQESHDSFARIRAISGQDKKTNNMENQLVLHNNNSNNNRSTPEENHKPNVAPTLQNNSSQHDNGRYVVIHEKPLPSLFSDVEVESKSKKIFITVNGRVCLDHTKIQFDFLQYKKEYQSKPIKEWPQCIYERYIDIINISHETRMRLVKHFKQKNVKKCRIFSS